MTLRPAQLQTFSLAGSGVILGETTITLTSFQSIDGVDLAMSDFGSIGYGTIEPNSGIYEEQISFTGVTQNSNGTATLTGVSSVLFLTPYTETSGLSKTHAGGVKFVISNTSGYYNTFLNKSDTATITAIYTFATGATPVITDLPVNPTDAANKAYADSLAIAGAPNASTSVQGLVQEATTAQLNAGTATGSTGAKLFGSPADFAASIYGLQLPSSGQKDALAGTSGTPSTSNKYVTNDDVAAAATASKVARRNSTGDVTVNTTPTAGTDAASKTYADTLQSQFKNGTITRDMTAASGAVTTAHGLGRTPRFVKITGMNYVGGAITDSVGVYNGTTTSSISRAYEPPGSGSTIQSSSNIIELGDDGGTFTANQAATITVDATNITLTWTKTGSPGASTASILWEAQV